MTQTKPSIMFCHGLWADVIRTAAKGLQEPRQQRKADQCARRR